MSRKPPPRKVAPFSGGERALIWLCLLTPGIAVSLLLIVYVDWVGSWMSPRHFGGEALVYGAILAIFLGCAGFAGHIHALKSGREKLVSRSIKLAFEFLLVQVFLAPFVIVIIAKMATQTF
jgi:hypothetical protein